MAVWIHNGVFWVVTLGSVVVGYQHFGGLCCLHSQGEMEAAWSSKVSVYYHNTMLRHNTQDLDLKQHISDTAVNLLIQVEFFWVVTPCNFVVGYQHFRGSCCLHLQVVTLYSDVVGYQRFQELAASTFRL